MPKDVFVSHSSKDKQIATTICKALEERGIDCWIAPRDIGAGENFQESIVRAIRGAKIMVLVFSGNTNDSGEVKKELVLASQHQLSVIPLRTEAVVPGEAFAYELSTRQWVDLFHNWEVEIGRVGEQIRTMLNSGPAPALAVAPSAPPPPKPTVPQGVGIPKIAIMAAAVALLLAAGGYFLFGRSPSPAPTASTVPAPVAPAQTASTAPAPVAAVPAAQPAPAAPAQTEAMFWDAIRNGTSVGSYEAYLRQYPDGQFAAVARMKIDELNAQASALPIATALASCPDAHAAAGGGASIPADEALRLKIAQALIECGTTKTQNRDLGAASNEIGVGRDIAEKLATAFPDNREYKNVLALAHSRTAIVLRAQGDRAGAIREFEASIKLRGEVVTMAPRLAIPLIFLALAEANLGQAQWETGQRGDARQSYGQCVTHRREASALRPNNPEWRDLAQDCQAAIAAIDRGAPASPPPSERKP